MELYVQSMAATRLDAKRKMWIPSHAVWMEFGPSHDYDQSALTLGTQRTDAMFPKSLGWIPRPPKIMRLGVEWMYAIMQSEETIPQVFALSLSSVIALPGAGVPFKLFHQPYLVTSASVREAQHTGLQEAARWWPKVDGYLSYGVKAWHISAFWFRRNVEDVLATGQLTTNAMREDTYASAA